MSTQGLGLIETNKILVNYSQYGSSISNIDIIDNNIIQPDILGSYANYTFKNGVLLPVDNSSNSQHLLNYGGKYTLEDNRNSLFLTSNNSAIIPATNWREYNNLCISGWFKTSDLATNDEIFRFGKSFFYDTTNIVAWYRFDDNATNMLLDSSGNNYNLTNNSATFDTTNYKSGSGSVALSGTTQYLDINANINPYNIVNSGNGGITFSIWFKIPLSTATYSRIFSFGDGTIGGQSANSIFVAKNNTLASLYFESRINGTTVSWTTSILYLDNNWHHIVLSISTRGLWMVYIDNILYSTTITNKIIPNANWTKRYIGRSEFDAALYTTGNIDDFRIYNRILTTDEVAALYWTPFTMFYNNLNNLICWYKFDNNGLTIDSSRNGNNLTNYSTTFINTDYKLGQGCVSFNGSSYLQITNDGRFSPDNFTISCWCKIVQPAANTYVIIAFSRTELNNSLRGWNIYVYNNNLQFWTGYGGTTAVPWSGSDVSIYNNFATNPTVWRHLVITMNKSTSNAILYIDGILISTLSRSYANNPTDNFFIGGVNGNFYLPNNSLIDDFRMYNRVLTTDEITTLYKYSSSLFNDTIGLISWYKFDNNATDMLLDSSGNRYNLTNNSATFDTTSFKTGNGSVYLNGSSQYLDINASINPYNIWVNNGITFSVWFKMSISVVSWARIFNFSDNAASVAPTNYIIISKGSTTTLLFEIMVNNTKTSHSTTLSYIDNLWHHIIWTISSTGVWTIYIDGMNLNINITRTIPNATWTRRYIGRSSFSGDGWYIGNIDDFRIYNRVLAPDEVSAIYYSTVSSYIETPYNMSLIKRNEYLSFQVNDIPVYETSNIVNNTWNHFIWNVIDTTTTQGFIRINNGNKILFRELDLAEPILTLFPPAQMTNYSTIINGITYRVCAIDHYGDSTTNYKAWEAFSRNYFDRFITNYHYNDTTGNLLNNGYNFGNDINFRGYYIGIDMGQKIVLKSYDIIRYPNTLASERLPKTWKIYATNDSRCWNNTGGPDKTPCYNTGAEFGWVEIDYRVNQTTYTNDTAFTISNNFKGYRFYALHVNAVRGGIVNAGLIQISEWLIYGYPYHTYDNTLGKITNKGKLYLNDFRLHTSLTTSLLEDNFYDKYTLLNINGILAFTSNENNIISISKKEIELNSINYGSTANLSISTWFKTTNFTNNDNILEISNNFINDTTNLYFWYKFNSHQFLKNFGITGSTYDLILSSAANTVSCQTSDKAMGDGSANFTASSEFLYTPIYNFATNFITACTISFWLKHKGVNVGGVILCGINSSFAANAIISIQRDILFNSWEIQFFGNTSNTNGFLNDFTATNSTWNHYIFIAEKSGTATKLTIYKNGSQVYTSTAGTWTPPSNLGFMLSHNNSSSTLIGNLDDFRIYNKVLSTTEISQLYNLQNLNNIIIKRNNNQLSFQVNSTSVYDTTFIDNKWNHILWNINNDTTSQGFIRINNGTKQNITKTSLANVNTYLSKLGSQLNSGDLYLYDFKIIINPLTTQMENDLYNNVLPPDYSEFTKINNIQIYPDKIKVKNNDFINISSNYYLNYDFKQNLLTVDSSSNIRNLNITDLTGLGSITTTYIKDFNRDCLLLKSGQEAFFANDNWMNYKDLSISGWFKSDRKQDGDDIILNMTTDILPNNSFFNDITNLHFWYKFNSVDTLKNYGLAGKDYDLFNSSTVIYPQKTDKVYGDASVNFISTAGKLYINNNYDFSENFTSSCTISFWIKRKALNTNWDVIFYTVLNGGENYNIIIQRNVATNYWRICYFGFDTNTNNLLNDYIADNDWNHYVWIAEKQSDNRVKISCYKNSVFIFSSTGGTWTTINCQFKISDNDSTASMIGNLDDFRIYNKVLSQNEINVLFYNTGFNNHTANLVVWYQFNDNATNMLNDSSGNNNMLINNGVAFDGENFRTGNGSAFFNATLKWFNIPSTINPYTIMINGGITIACWFKISFITSGNGRIFEFSDNAVNVSPTNAFLMRIDSTTKQLVFTINTITHLTPNFYNDDIWHHIAWSITSTGIWTIYIDGVNIGANRTQVIPNATWVKRYIGRGWQNGADFLCGNIDDFRIYNRVLTASESYSLYSVNYNMPNNYIVKRQNNILSFQINNTPVYEVSYTNDTWNHFIWNIASSTSTQGFVKLNNGSKNYFNEILPSVPNIFKYPTASLLGSTTGLSGFGINSGYYTVSSSASLNSTETSNNAFNSSNFSTATANIWTSSSTYNGTTGAYTGAVTTTVSGTSYLGEWLQIQLPTPIVLSYYYIYANTSTRFPKNFIIAGSNNGSLWSLIDTETNSQVFQNNSRLFILFNNTIAYSYYRLIVQANNNNTNVSIQEWELYGYPIYFYTNKLGSLGNQGTLYLSDFSIITAPINNIIETQLYSQALEYKNLSTNEFIQSQIRNVNALYYNTSKKIEGNQYGANVYGTLTATGNITSYFSDIRLKDIVCNIEYPIEKINNISTFKYIPNELAKSIGINDTKINIGISAQDVQSVLPEIIDLAPVDTSNLSTGEIVSRTGNNFLSVSYTDLVPLLIEAIKDLNKKLKEKTNFEY